MVLDFNKPLLDVKGTETKQTLNVILADLIATETKGNARKLGIWMRLLSADQSLDLDKVDAKALEDLIEGNDRVVVLVKDQLLQVIDEAKEAEKKEA
jgi:hypothetical protein